MSSILIVERDQSTINWVKQVLDKLRHQTFIHSNTSISEILSIIQENNIELVILGISNSNQDFFEVLNALKDDSGYEAIPILIMEKNENPNLLAKYLDKGVYGFLHRSSNDIYIQSRVRSALKTFDLIKRYKDINDKLEQKNEQMDEFVGIVSHDLRIPIGNLSSICEMLEEEPDMLSDIIVQMKETVQNASTLINDLLDLTAMETGKTNLDKNLCSVKELFAQAAQDTMYLLDKKKIKLKIESSDEHLVNVDARRILQVLSNLINNAVKFTYESGEIVLHSCLEKGSIIISVRDNGIGIGEEKIPKLFLKHSRISSQGTNGEQGTGFGLPLSQSYVVAHDSILQVKSEVGNGTEFFFSLPSEKKEKV